MPKRREQDRLRIALDGLSSKVIELKCCYRLALETAPSAPFSKHSVSAMAILRQLVW